MPFDNVHSTFTELPFPVSAEDLAFMHTREFVRTIAPKYRALSTAEARVIYQQSWLKTKRVLNGISPWTYEQYLAKKPIADAQRKRLESVPPHQRQRYFDEYKTLTNGEAL